MRRYSSTLNVLVCPKRADCILDIPEEKKFAMPICRGSKRERETLKKKQRIKEKLSNKFISYLYDVRDSYTLPNSANSRN